MRRSVRWLAACGMTAITFGACLWAARALSFSWEPKDQADRWLIATAFASVMAGAVLAALGWWAGRDIPPTHVRAATEEPRTAAGVPDISVQTRALFGPPVHLGSGDINQISGDAIVVRRDPADVGQAESHAKYAENTSEDDGQHA